MNKVKTMYRRKKFEVKYIILVVLIVLIVFLVIVNAIMKNHHNVNFINGFFKDSILFVNKVVNTPINFVRDKIDENNTKKDLLKKYNKLKDDYASTEELRLENAELTKEIEELKKALDLKNVLSDYQKINSVTLNRNLGYWYRNITIDKGKKDGIKENMAVINSDGLIGTIYKTSNHTSTVKLLTSNQFNKISVKIEVDGQYIYALLTGFNEKDETFTLEGVSENTEIPVGSKVTTTGMGSIFPSGILVGKVTQIDTDSYDLAKIIKIKSNVNFNDLNIVTVLKRDGN